MTYKIFSVLFAVFLGLFLLSALMVLTNALNMWLVLIVSLPLCIVCYVAKAIAKKREA